MDVAWIWVYGSCQDDRSLEFGSQSEEVVWMKIIKFSMNEAYYEQLKGICDRDGITVKRKLNILLSQDTAPVVIKDHFPADANEKSKSITLKINEELYKGIMKNCGKFNESPRHYVPYLIYKYLKTING